MIRLPVFETVTHSILSGSKSSHTKKPDIGRLGFVEKSVIIPLTITLKSGLTEVVKFLQDNGFNVSKAFENTLVIRAEAEAKKLRKVFKVALFNFKDEKKGEFISHLGDITIPKEISEHVTHIFGLDQTPKFNPYFRTLAPPLILPNNNPTVFYPNFLATIYNFPNTTGKNQNVGIIELGGGYTIQTINAYFDRHGVKRPTIISVSVDGATNNPSDTSGANGEVQLDIEVVGMISPDSKIVVYFTPNTDKGFYDALMAAANDTANNPSVISISWGAAEVYWSNSSMQQMNNALQYCISKGISVFAAAGDNGASDGVNNGKVNVDFPASSPYITACGGTKLTVYNNRRSTEVVWNETNSDSGATGGGVSTVFPVPSYQSKYVRYNTDTGLPGRAVPDVSGDADPTTGYIVDVDGQEYVIGGTSAVSPLYSALTARINELNGRRCGFWNNKIYKHPQYFWDIKSGNNDGYSAKKGYDPCTGLGVADGTLIANAF